MRLLKRFAPALGIIGVLAVTACFIVSSSTDSYLVGRDETGSVMSPVKAHMIDGSVIVYSGGITVLSRRVFGSGVRYTSDRRLAGTAAAPIPLDSVAGFEVYERHTNPGRTLVYSTVATAASTVGLLIADILIFGSCPTVYADSAGVETLQAESFSYSISPLLAKRDVDRMTVVPDAHGVIRLRVRNEALETHHIDHIELVEVAHDADAIAVPSPRGGALALRRALRAEAHDGRGRDIARLIEAPDALEYRSGDALLSSAIAGGPTTDEIVLAIPRPRGVDSVGLLLRARTTLLTSNTLYEHILGRQGPMALDFMGETLTQIANLARLGNWFGANFGMRVEIADGTEWKQVIRLMDFGPTAWRTVGLALPPSRGPGDTVRVRLIFPVDGFHIDQAALFAEARRPAQRIVPAARITDRSGAPRPDMLAMLAKADDRFVETSPGTEFGIEFDAAQPAPSIARTYFLAAQGYYTEWLRPSWMAESPQRFEPTSNTMRDVLASWRAARDSLEAGFFIRRVPIL